jgi:hypothetical protein
MAKQVVPGNNALSIDGSGWVLFKRPHGTFYSLTSQTIASVTSPQVVALEKDYDVEGMIHSLTTGSGLYNSRVYVPTAGSYEILFSGIAKETTADKTHIDVWFRVNGTDIVDSNTRVELATKDTECTVVVAIIIDMNGGDYVEAITCGDSLTLSWLYTALSSANPVRPATPSVIMTVKKISSKLSYE